MKKILSLTLAILLTAAGAQAHAFLDHASPRVGNTVEESPREVRLWFTEKLEPALSKAQVFDANGQAVAKQVEAADPKDASVLVVSVPPLKPGKYKVVWKVVSVDSHLTSGSFSFTVKP